jgi:2-hydroxychromene-2-carboxylate isomerase
MSTEPIDFYFDFSSPYSYLLSERIDALAQRFGRKVKWHPILLGAVFKRLGSAPLTLQMPAKAIYSIHDFSRSARFMNLPYRHPATFPIATVGAARAYYWLHGQDCALARRFAQVAFRAFFVDGIDISANDAVLDLAVALGVDRVALAAGMQEPAIKDRLRDETDAAVDRGVFGAPAVFIDNELFWGADRLPQIEKWLETGGF